MASALAPPPGVYPVCIPILTSSDAGLRCQSVNKSNPVLPKLPLAMVSYYERNSTFLMNPMQLQLLFLNQVACSPLCPFHLLSSYSEALLLLNTSHSGSVYLFTTVILSPPPPPSPPHTHTPHSVDTRTLSVLVTLAVPAENTLLSYSGHSVLSGCSHQNHSGEE